MSVLFKEDLDGGYLFNSIDFDQLFVLGGINLAKPKVLARAFRENRASGSCGVSGHPFLTVRAPGHMECDNPDGIRQVHHLIPVVLVEYCINSELLLASKYSCEERAQDSEDKLQFHSSF